jgi:ATP-binding cassette subfamily B protein
VLVIATFIVSRLGDFLIVKGESNLLKGLKDYAMKGLLQKSTHFFETHRLGGLVAKSKRFASESETVVDQFVFSIVRSALFVIYLIIFTAIVVPSISWILAIWVALFLSVSIVLSKERMKRDMLAAEQDSQTLGFLSDVLSSNFILRIYARSPAEYNTFMELTEKERVIRLRAWFFGNFQWGIQSLLTYALEIVVMAVVISQYLNKTATIGTIAMVQAYIISLSMNMWDLGKSIIRTRTAFAEAYEMSSLLDHENSEPVDEGSIDVTPITNSITISNLSFAYNRKNEAIRNLSFSFEAGRHYGLIGTSGSGKTTLTKLLPRLYEIKQGEVLIRGIDIKTIHKNVLRSWISYVPQLPMFPSRTVREIFLLGKPNATDDEIIIAAKKASCSFIWEKLPEGLDTQVGERGIKLSGGEAQRVAIATAILKDAPIVIMDEPTSALDAVTESSIQRSIKEHFVGKTLIVIAHRLSTVAVLDEILVMKGGTIIDSGPHEELLESSADYRHLWHLQTKPTMVV